MAQSRMGGSLSYPAGFGILYKERFTKSVTTPAGNPPTPSGSGTLTYATSNVYPLNRSFIVPVGNCGNWAELADFGAYLSGVQTATVKWSGGANGGSTIYAEFEIICLAMVPKSIQTVLGVPSGGSVTLGTPLANYQQALIINSTQMGAQCLDGSSGYNGCFAKLTSNTNLSFYTNNDAGVVSGPVGCQSAWVYTIIQP